MTRDQWQEFVTDELTKLAPDKQAMKARVERQGSKVDMSESGRILGSDPTASPQIVRN